MSRVNRTRVPVSDSLPVEEEPSGNENQQHRERSRRNGACVPINNCHPSSCVAQGRQEMKELLCTRDLQCTTSMDCDGYCELNGDQCESFNGEGVLLSSTKYDPLPSADNVTSVRNPNNTCVPIHYCHPTQCVLEGQQIEYKSACGKNLICGTTLDCGGYCRLSSNQCQAYNNLGQLLSTTVVRRFVNHRRARSSSSRTIDKRFVSRYICPDSACAVGCREAMNVELNADNEFFQGWPALYTCRTKNTLSVDLDQKSMAVNEIINLNTCQEIPSISENRLYEIWKGTCEDDESVLDACKAACIQSSQRRERTTCLAKCRRDAFRVPRRSRRVSALSSSQVAENAALLNPCMVENMSCGVFYVLLGGIMMVVIVLFLAATTLYQRKSNPAMSLPSTTSKAGL